MSQLTDTDSALQQAVLAELSWEASVGATHVGVRANSGIVTLTGHVESFVQKHSAELAARRVKNVAAVVVEIEVRLPFDSTRNDEDIAAAVVNRLDWDASVPRDSVRASIDKGWITLNGEVEWHFQREAASEDVRRLLGVTGVSNQITIRSRADVSQIREQLVHALQRSWSDPARVVVSAEGGAVRLTGTARTPRDRELIATTAWSAPGVTSVENDLTISL